MGRNGNGEKAKFKLESYLVYDTGVCPFKAAGLAHREQEDFKLPREASGLKNIHVLIRAGFCLKKVGDLQLKITGDDRYKLYLDGAFVQEGPAPSYPGHYYYNEIKLSGMAKGEHVLGIHLYYQGCINRVFYSGDLRMAFAAELRGESGETIPLAFVYKKTDACQGDTIGYDTQFLENFDAGKFPAGWNLAGFKEEEFEPAVPAGGGLHPVSPAHENAVARCKRAKGNKPERGQDFCRCGKGSDWKSFFSGGGGAGKKDNDLPRGRIG